MKLVNILVNFTFHLVHRGAGIEIPKDGMKLKQSKWKHYSPYQYCGDLKPRTLS
jgi:hypothetical protein